ncbi:hypothetical protein PanWU01x14_106090 [Parasponia andersonii]|uniref:Uncharacterized protein n=1 Tax=Parasponia andersonii TaxID=3476 RepID=A0A2P5D193_PARAD|nr:hypothetical protein PanWU01x14_106090 [Parasponia andersonii]
MPKKKKEKKRKVVGAAAENSKILCKGQNNHLRACRNLNGEGLQQLDCIQKLERTLHTDHKIITLMIKRTNMMKHMITRTDAHITIPPCFCVLSACKPQYVPT